MSEIISHQRKQSSRRFDLVGKMEHFKSRNNDFFHFTNPHDDASEIDDDDVDDYDEFDDDRSCDFNFHNFHPIGITQFPFPNSQNDTVTTSMEKLGTFNNGALISHLDNTMKNLSDKLQHRIEGISTQISHLEDETCKLDKHVEDVKNVAEKYHGTTHMKLSQMHNALQEVQDGVQFLRDKHEIAETKLQLAKLQSSKRDKVQTNQQSSFRDPRFSHVTFQGVVSPQNHHFLNHLSQESPYMSSFSYSPSVPHFPSEHEQGLSHLGHVPSRNYKSEFHAKYMPEFTSFSNTEPPFLVNYIHTPVSQTQTLPYALPTAVDVKDVLSSEGNDNTISVDDIIDKVTTMGFRRDIVKASVRKLIENGSTVDLNAVLDRMMNNK